MKKIAVHPSQHKMNVVSETSGSRFRDDVHVRSSGTTRRMKLAKENDARMAVQMNGMSQSSIARSTKESDGRGAISLTRFRYPKQAQARSTARSADVSLAQWLHLVHRFLILGAAMLYVVTGLKSVYSTVQIMTMAPTPAMYFAPYTSVSVAHLVQNASAIATSPLMALLQYDTTPRNATLYVNVPDLDQAAYASFEQCPTVISIEEIYHNSFIRSVYDALMRDASYHLTFLRANETQLIAPIIDCSASARVYEDSATVRLFFLLKNLQTTNASDSVYLMTMTLSNQGFVVTSRGEEGALSVATISLIRGQLSANVSYSFVLSLGYPFQSLAFQVYEHMETTRDGYWKLRSIPKDPTTEVARTLLTSSRTGFYADSEADQSNIKNEFWTLHADPIDSLRYMSWEGTTVLRDSWAWVHLIHLAFAIDVLLELVVLVIVIYRNWQIGKLWIGDSFVSISNTPLFRGLLVLLSWYCNKLWSLTEFAYADGNEISMVEEIYVREAIMHADVMVLYLSIVGLIGKICSERIDPALTMALFELGFQCRHFILNILTPLVDYINTKTLVDYLLGVVATEEDLSIITPMRLWNIHALSGYDPRLYLCVLAPIFASLIVIFIYVGVKKLRKLQSQRRKIIYPKPSLIQLIRRRSSAFHGVRTQFEIATGRTLAHQFGLMASYENHRVIKGLTYVSADGVYSNGFVIANHEYLVATSDMLAILIMKCTHVRYRNVYVYDVDGHDVQQMARLVYPQTLSWTDLVNLNITVLS